MEVEIFISPWKNIIFIKKIPLKETKILQDIIITLINNLKFQHKPKYIIFQKSSYNKIRPINYYLGAYKNPLSYYYTL